MVQMSKIEDLVIFKNEKELSETEKSIEKIFGISFQSYVRRLEIGLDAEGLSHDDDSAVAHILADMGKRIQFYGFSVYAVKIRERLQKYFMQIRLVVFWRH